MKFAIKNTLNIYQEIESTVPESVTTLVSVRWWTPMKNNQIKDEIVYQLTMKYVKKMLEQRIITLEEYVKIDS